MGRKSVDSVQMPIWEVESGSEVSGHLVVLLSSFISRGSQRCGDVNFLHHRVMLVKAQRTGP